MQHDSSFFGGSLESFVVGFSLYSQIQELLLIFLYVIRFMIFLLGSSAPSSLKYKMESGLAV